MRKTVARELMRKVKKDYNSIAGEFSTSRANPWYEFEIYKELLEKGDKVMDLGCGNGRLLDYIDERDIDYVGVDISERLLEKAQRHYDGRGMISKWAFKTGEFLDLPYNSPRFDKIFSIASFHHIPSRELRLEALENMKQCLKQDGRIVISVWNLWRRKYRKRIYESLWRLHKYDLKDCFIPWSDSGVDRYYHAFTVFEMRSLLDQAGLYIVDEVYAKMGGVTDNFWEADNLVFIAKPI